MMLLALVLAAARAGAAAEESKSGSANDKIWIYHLTPDARGGRAYKLVYLVTVPIDIYWGFKTDFDNDFLIRNKYIEEHRLISRNGNTVLTGNRYTHGPDGLYRWKTTVMADKRRLEYVLVNPEEMEQKFHYGYIQLAPVREGTLVTQVAYFDFWGVSLWAAYPWTGGMKAFLFYTARWEQEMVLELQGHYSTGGYFPYDHP
jgi:hypothetical protein